MGLGAEEEEEEEEFIQIRTRAGGERFPTRWDQYAVAWTTPSSLADRECPSSLLSKPVLLILICLSIISLCLLIIDLLSYCHHPVF